MAELVLIGLGSNLCRPVQQVTTALKNIAQIPSVTLLRQSSFYESIPQGPHDQPNFINSVILIKTDCSAVQLLIALQKIEQQQGRVKKRHWGERTIDLDILFYGCHNINHSCPDLTVPHPQALLRDFVLLPALEIFPEWQLPDGTFLKSYPEQCQDHQIKRIDPANY